MKRKADSAKDRGHSLPADELLIAPVKESDLVTAILDLSAYSYRPSWEGVGEKTDEPPYDYDGHSFPRRQGRPVSGHYQSFDTCLRILSDSRLLVEHPALSLPLLVQALDYDAFVADHYGHRSCVCSVEKNTRSGICWYGIMTGTHEVRELLMKIGLRNDSAKPLLKESLESDNTEMRVGSAYCLVMLGEAETVFSDFGASKLNHPSSIPTLDEIAAINIPKHLYHHNLNYPPWKRDLPLERRYRKTVQRYADRAIQTIVNRYPMEVISCAILQQPFPYGTFYYLVRRVKDPSRLLQAAVNVPLSQIRDVKEGLVYYSSLRHCFTGRGRYFRSIARASLRQIYSSSTIR